MSAYSTLPFSDAQGAVWDDIVRNSRNGTFLHLRNFINYHRDRFDEHSLVVLKGKKPVAVFPATLHGDTVVSHGGLTFGGLIYGMGVHASDVVSIMGEIVQYYRQLGAKFLRYKAVPHIFHSYPGEEDLYALFRQSATLVRRDISSAVTLFPKPRISTLRKRGVKKALKADLDYHGEIFLAQFHDLLSQVLKKFNAVPVHTLNELELLQARFPENISLVGVFDGTELLAASWLFNYGRVLHTQYLASSDRGRKLGALDYLIFNIMENPPEGVEMVNFGISTEDNGRRLNEGLIFQKEGFGGRGIVYDQYEVKL